MENENFIYLVQMIFKSRDLTHIAHLKTTSYAEHIALEEYYDAVVDLIDDLVETYQGEYGVLLDIIIPETKFEDPQAFLRTLLELSNSATYSSAVQNILDDVNTLISKTLYKLKFLK